MKRIQLISLLLLITLSPFLLAELALRLSGYRLQFPYQDDPEIGYALQPGYRGKGPDLYGIPRKIKIKVNSMGFRGEEIQEKKPPHTYRIVALGDSCTFGLGLTLDESFPFQVQEMLNESGGGTEKFEVVNAGVPGFTSFQGLQMLRSRVLPLQPDLVLIYFGWNDHWFADQGVSDEEHFPEMHAFLQARAVKIKRNPFRNLRIYQGMTDLLLRMQDTTRHKTESTKPPRQVLRVPVEKFEQNLIQMVKLGKEHQIQTIIITPPHGFLTGQIPKEFLVINLMKQDDTLIALHESYIAASKQAAKKSGAALLDVARFFDEADRKSLMEKDGIHPNATGQRIIAHEVTKAVKSLRAAKW